MPYFLADDNLEIGKEVKMSGEEARHILLSHRIKSGEQIKLQGPDGQRYLAEVIKADKKFLIVKALSSLAIPQEPAIAVTLFQAIVSEKALDFIFQKGTELGLNKIVLFNSGNTAVKLAPDKFQAKKDRWNKILIEAAKQSERAKWPELEFASNVNRVIELIKACDKIFFADIEGTKLKTIDAGIKSAGLIIGPEGGFSEAETIELKLSKNCQTISLSNFVLRAETAAIAGSSLVLSQI